MYLDLERVQLVLSVPLPKLPRNFGHFPSIILGIPGFSQLHLQRVSKCIHYGCINLGTVTDI